jgi:acyl-CoA synthetase (AMP-forming)/AMP-acid ligase II
VTTRRRRSELQRLLLDSAERAPDAVAYGPARQPVRYGPLALRAARVAGTLREAGVRRGGRVTIALDGCVEYVVAYYGVLMAGAVVVPVSPDTRGRALSRVLDHSESTALIAPGSLLAHLADPRSLLPGLRAVLSAGAPVGALPPSVELVDLEDAQRDGVALFNGASGDSDLACIQYTSGTSGGPKGVMLSHRNVVSNVRAVIEYLELRAEDRLAMVLPYHYVYGSSVLHTHLAVGGSIVQAGTTAFPVRVLETAQDEGCTGLSGVPSTFAALLRVGDPGRFDMSRLRYLTQAGGPMNQALAARVRAAFPRAKLFVMYGQTEASARLSYLPPEDLDRKPGSVGVPVRGVAISVVDATGRPVRPGTLGEVIATGSNVMMGYLREPAATRHALRGGALHTGDIGFLDRDGYLYISGRHSEMISSGGHRIGPQEIEDVVSAMSDVEECAVVGVEDDMLGQRIVAVVVPRDGRQPDPRAVQRACLDVLPRHKVPSEVRLVADLPRSDRGKLLRTVVRARLEAEAAGDLAPEPASVSERDTAI